MKISKSSYLRCAAALTTVIGGILHLSLAHPFQGPLSNMGIFFIVSGIAQIFWLIPLVRDWHKGWYYTGIGGTIVLIAMWAITRMPGNPITGRGGPVSPMAILLELFQAAFIVLLIAIIFYQRKSHEKITRTAKKSQVMILVGIVVAILLAGLFIPASSNQPNGSPQFGGPPNGPPPQFGAQQTGTATYQTCTLTPSLIEVESTPQQTEGPYFVDEKLDRSDIRADPSDGLIQDGIPLHLVIHVYDVVNGSCMPLSGAQVDIWHANSQGLYSDIQGINTLGKKYLRGYQITNNNGTVEFTTSYPGWYEGRATHIHIKVRTFDGDQKTFEWTSQFYFDDSITAQIYSQSPYSNHGQSSTRNSEDGIYNGPSTDSMFQSNAGTHLMLNLSKDDQSYSGTFNVGIETGQSRQ